MSDTGPAAPSILQQGTAAGRGREVRLHRYPDRYDGARPKLASE